MLTTALIIIAICSFFGFVYCGLGKRILQQKLSVVESNLEGCSAHLAKCEKRLASVEHQQSQKLSADQLDFKKRLEAQYAVLFERIQKNLNDELDSSKEDFETKLKKCKEDFAAELKGEFDKACELIKFGEIEYKRTITKKRKEHNRKNGKNAKPQRIWRYIDEE